MRAMQTSMGGKPLAVPYTIDGEAKGARWDYRAHARLAYGLYVNADDVIPEFSDEQIGDEPENMQVFAEIVRQCCMKALRREPKEFFESREMEHKLYEAQGEYPKEVEAGADAAIRQADAVVRRFFDPDREAEARNGRRLIEQILDFDRERIQTEVKEGFFEN